MENKNLVEINIEAFKCEMRTFPYEKITAPEKLVADLNTLSPADKNKAGLALYLGHGIPRDPERAKQIWLDTNDAEAKLYLSVDKFLENDLNKGVIYLAEASKLGLPTAQLRYAYCLILGIGVEANLENAYKIFKKLANEQVPCAVYFLGAMHMTREQTLVEYDPKRAQELLDWSVSHGCKFAQFEQGVVDLRKAKTDAAIKQAYGLIAAAAEQYEPRAMFYYSLALARGDQIEKNTVLAQEYLDRCLDLGFSPAVDAVKEAVKKL